MTTNYWPVPPHGQSLIGFVLENNSGGIVEHHCQGVPIPAWFTIDPAALYARVLLNYSREARYILELGSGPEGISGKIFMYQVSLMGGHAWSIDCVDFKRSSNCYITYILGDTLEVPWNYPVDLLYVDASHVASRVKAELYKYGPWVWRGGKILMDDLRHAATPATASPTELEPVADAFCKEFGLTWRYCAPIPNKIAVIEVTQPIPSPLKEYIDWNTVKIQDPHDPNYRTYTHGK